MKINEIEAILREKTTLRETWVHTKAVLIFLGKRDLNQVISEHKKPITSMSKQKIWIGRGFFFELGFDEKEVERKVTNITEGFSTLKGFVKIAGKRVEVSKSSDNEWIVDYVLKG